MAEINLGNIKGPKGDTGSQGPQGLQGPKGEQGIQGPKGEEFNVLNSVYPVGAVYISVVNTNPTSLFGGVWEPFAEGRTLVGLDTSQSEFNSPGKTGGSKTHTLSENEMPSHQHVQTYGLANTSGNGYGGLVYDITLNPRGSGTRAYTEGTGGGASHNNLQPYITTYMWKRIS